MAPEEREDPAKTAGATQVSTDEGFKDAEDNVVDDKRSFDDKGNVVANEPAAPPAPPHQGEGEPEPPAPPF